MLILAKFTHYILFATDVQQEGDYCAIVIGTNEEITTGINQTFRYVHNPNTSMMTFNGSNHSITGYGNSEGAGTLTITTR